MVSLLFGFGGRVGRLEFFMLSCALGLFALLLGWMIYSGLAPQPAAPGHHAAAEAMVRPALIAVVLIAPFFIWFSLTLQAKRFRDMGWNPAIALFFAFALPFFARLVAPLFPPALLLSALFSFGIWLCLQFWPSAPGGAGSTFDPRIFDENWPEAEGEKRPSRAPGPLPATAPARPAFGRRGL